MRQGELRQGHGSAVFYDEKNEQHVAITGRQLRAQRWTTPRLSGLNARARVFGGGYETVEDYFEANPDKSQSEMADELGCSIAGLHYRYRKWRVVKEGRAK